MDNESKKLIEELEACVKEMSEDMNKEASINSELSKKVEELERYRDFAEKAASGLIYLKDNLPSGVKLKEYSSELIADDPEDFLKKIASRISTMLKDRPEPIGDLVDAGSEEDIFKDAGAALIKYGPEFVTQNIHRFK